MGRLACVNVFALPLQLLLAKHSDWADHPVCVVSEDKPNGLIEWTNERAHAQGILRGMRYSAALSLDGSLRAGVITPTEVAAAEKAIVKTLRHYTPHIDAEASPSRPHGVYMLNASGLFRLYPALEYWARALLAELKGIGFSARIVVGFHRFHTFAIARASQRPIVVFEDQAREERVSMRVPLERLLLDSRARDTLHKLGVTTVGQLLALPEGGLHRRFGPELSALWVLAKGQRLEPLANTPEDEPVTAEVILDFAETDAERLLFVVKRLLHPMLDTLANQGQAVRQLHLHCELDHHATCTHMIAPAEATLDSTLLLDLVRLKLSSIAFGAGVKHLRLNVDTAEAPREQLKLFRETAKRDLRAAERAFARLRAEFGDNAVCFAKLKEGHLPEARFQWMPAERITTPEPRHNVEPLLVRSFHNKALPLPFSDKRNPEGWMLAGLTLGAVQRMHGPYVISGGWWRHEIQRDYYYAELQRGDWLWIYFDHGQRAWRQVGKLQ